MNSKPDEIRFEFRNGLPVVVVPATTPPIDPAAVRRVLEEEGLDGAVANCSLPPRTK